MASRTTYIPRFLLPQNGPMWRTTLRATAPARYSNVELGQVVVRYASNAASRRPVAAKSALAKVATQRTAFTKSGPASKAAKAYAPTKPPSKHVAKTPTSISQQPVDPATTRAPTPTTPPAASAGKPIAAQAVAPKIAAAPPPKPDPSKPIVLEKPEKFNPPSHGSRLPRSTPRHYGGSMTAEEVKIQGQRTYPGLPPPPNTWSHWFINNRGIHMFITLGTLTSLALFTFAQNFKARSPFVDMIPPISELPRHPFQYLGICLEVLRLDSEHESAQTAEKRRRKVEDIAKREEYRKAHGLEPVTSGLFGAKVAEPAPAPVAVETVDEASPVAVVQSSAPKDGAAAEFTSDGKRKKFLGIF